MKLKKWKEVAQELKLSEASANNASTELKNHYYKYLYAYELNQKARAQHIRDPNHGYVWQPSFPKPAPKPKYGKNLQFSFHQRE